MVKVGVTRDRDGSWSKRLGTTPQGPTDALDKDPSVRDNIAWQCTVDDKKDEACTHRRGTDDTIVPHLGNWRKPSTTQVSYRDDGM